MIPKWHINPFVYLIVISLSISYIHGKNHNVLTPYSINSPSLNLNFTHIKDTFDETYSNFVDESINSTSLAGLPRTCHWSVITYCSVWGTLMSGFVALGSTFWGTAGAMGSISFCVVKACGFLLPLGIIAGTISNIAMSSIMCVYYTATQPADYWGSDFASIQGFRDGWNWATQNEPLLPVHNIQNSLFKWSHGIIEFGDMENLAIDNNTHLLLHLQDSGCCGIYSPLVRDACCKSASQGQCYPGGPPSTTIISAN